MATTGKLIQVMMGVADMAESKKFYADTLGFAVITDYGQGNRHWVSLSFPEGGVTLTLTTFLAEKLKPGSQSLYVSTSDIQRAFDDLTGKGVQPTNPISDDLYGPGSGVKWFRLADPDGNELTVVQS